MDSGDNLANALKAAGIIEHFEWCAMRTLPGSEVDDWRDI